MNLSHPFRLPALLGAVLLLSGAVHAQAPESASASAPETDARNAPELRDFVREIVTRVEFTYPPNINDHPALAQRLAADTEDAMLGLFNSTPSDDASPYHEVHYQMVVQPPQVVAVVGKGHGYIIGANRGYTIDTTHVWLPEKQKWLDASSLMADHNGWYAVSEYVREDLYVQKKLIWPPPKDNYKEWFYALNWIDNGIGGPYTQNFKYFQPLMSDDGLIAALRFTFPPYQVSSWADGYYTVDVPANVLYPHVTNEYQDLFVKP